MSYVKKTGHVDAWNNFKSEFTKVLDSICPAKQIRLKQRTEPWINSDILETIRDRDKALYLHRKCNDTAHYSEYKHLRNRVQALVRQAKRHYLSNKLDGIRTTLVNCGIH